MSINNLPAGLSSLPPGNAVGLRRRLAGQQTGNNYAPTNQSNGYNSNLMASMLPMLLMGLLQMLMSQFGLGGGNYGNGNTQNPPPKPDNTGYPPPPPPPPAKNKVTGSAGLFGDPQFGVFTPGLGNVPAALKGFESHIKAGQTETLLKDTDNGGLEITGTGVQVDPNNPNSTGIGSATFKSGNDTVTISGNGDLLVNGQKKGNLNDDGLIAPIKLSNGMTVSTSQEVDGANGQKAERFVIANGDYKVTAAPRKPHAESTPYLDMNFEELKADAADNATGYKASVPGFTTQFGIADLLRLEPDNLNAIA